MLLKSVYIKNFRSFGPGGESIEFPDSKIPYILVGHNDSGKTNFLDALGLILGSYKFKRKEDIITIEDFYDRKLFNDEGEPVTLEIVVELYKPIKIRDAFKIYDVYKIRFFAKPYEINVGEGDIRFDTECLNKDNKIISLYSGRAISKEEKSKFTKEQIELLSSKALPARADVVTNRFTTWHMDVDDLTLGLSLKRGGPLGQILSIYKRELLSPNTPIEIADTKFDSHRDAFSYIKEKYLEKLINTKKWQNEIAPKINEKISSYLGSGTNPNLKLILGEINDLLSSSLKIRFQNPFSDKDTLLEKHGKGYQSLVRLAAIEALLELKEIPFENLIILFEEPEAYLHTHLSRKMRSLLWILAAKDATVIYSTHSKDLLDLRRYRSILRTKLTNSVTEIKTIKDTSLQFDDFEINISGGGNKELIFASGVILTEGRDDYVAICSGLNKINNLDLDALSISLLHVGGGGNLLSYAKLSEELEINWVVVTDGDLKPERQNELLNLREFEKKSKFGKIAVWKVDLETCLKTTKQNNNEAHIKGLLESKSIEEIKRDYPEYSKTVSEILKSLPSLKEFNLFSDKEKNKIYAKKTTN